MTIKQNYVCVTCGQIFTRLESGKRQNMSLHLEQSLIVDSTDYHVGIINGKYDQPEGSPAAFKRLKAIKIKTSIKQVSKQRNNPYFFKYKREDYKTNDRPISQNNNRYNGNPYNKGRKWPELQSHNYNTNLAHNYVNHYPNDESIQFRNFDSIQNYTKEFSNNDIIIVLLRLKKAVPYLSRKFDMFSLYCVIRKISWDCWYEKSYEPLDVFLRKHNLSFI